MWEYKLIENLEDPRGLMHLLLSTMQQSLVEMVCGLDIGGNAFSDDNYFKRRVTSTHRVPKPEADCVNLRDCLPSKSQTQVVLAVLINPIGGRANNCFLLSDLHGVTARLVVGQSAGGHPCLSKARARTDGGKSETAHNAQVVLLGRPVVTYDKESRNCTLYVDSQTQMELVGAPRFFGRCGAKTRAGQPCRVAIDTNSMEHCKLHAGPVPGQPRGVPPTPAQQEYALSTNLQGVQQLTGAPAPAAVTATAAPSSNESGSSTSGGTIPLTRRALPTAADSISQARQLGRPSAEGLRAAAAAAAAAVAAAAVPANGGGGRYGGFGYGEGPAGPSSEQALAALDRARIGMTATSGSAAAGICRPGEATAAAAAAADRKRERDPLAGVFGVSSKKSKLSPAAAAAAVMKANATGAALRVSAVTVMGGDDGGGDSSSAAGPRRGGGMDYDADDSVLDGYGGAASASHDGAVRVPEPCHRIFDRGLSAHRQHTQARTAKTFTGAQMAAGRVTAAHTQQPVSRLSAQAAAAGSGSQTALSHSRSHMQMKGQTQGLPQHPQANPNSILAAIRASASSSSSGGGVYTGLSKVGGVLVDSSRLNSNLNTASAPAPAQKAAVEQKKAVAKKAMDDEVAALLRRSSSHASEARDAAFEGAKEKMQTLERREFMTNKGNSVTSVKIRCFFCMSCKLCTETAPSLCYKQAHTVNHQMTVKRFWECKKCSRRENTLDGNTRTPKRACSQCSSYEWVPCGSRGSGSQFEGKPGRGINGEKLVLAAADGTTVSDKMTMAARVSNID